MIKTTLLVVLVNANVVVDGLRSYKLMPTLQDMHKDILKLDRPQITTGLILWHSFLFQFFYSSSTIYITLLYIGIFTSKIMFLLVLHNANMVALPDVGVHQNHLDFRLLQSNLH